MTTKLTPQKVQATNRNGTRVLHRIRELIRNGLNWETKHRTHVGSNEFIEAMFPVPKKANIMNTNCIDSIKENILHIYTDTEEIN